MVKKQFLQEISSKERSNFIKNYLQTNFKCDLPDDIQEDLIKCLFISKNLNLSNLTLQSAAIYKSKQRDEKYCEITMKQRFLIIQLLEDHPLMKIKDISQVSDTKYESTKSIIKLFKSKGRIGKKTHKPKTSSVPSLRISKENLQKKVNLTQKKVITSDQQIQKSSSFEKEYIMSENINDSQDIENSSYYESPPLDQSQINTFQQKNQYDQNKEVENSLKRKSDDSFQEFLNSYENLCQKTQEMSKNNQSINEYDFLEQQNKISINNQNFVYINFDACENFHEVCAQIPNQEEIYSSRNLLHNDDMFLFQDNKFQDVEFDMNQHPF